MTFLSLTHPNSTKLWHDWDPSLSFTCFEAQWEQPCCSWGPLCPISVERSSFGWLLSAVGFDWLWAPQFDDPFPWVHSPVRGWPCTLPTNFNIRLVNGSNGWSYGHYFRDINSFSEFKRNRHVSHFYSFYSAEPDCYSIAGSYGFHKCYHSDRVCV